MAQRKIIILLSGEISSGKSTLAKNLQDDFNFKICKTREAIKELGKKHLKGAEPDREFLQKFGESLDKKGNGKWVLNSFQEQYNNIFGEHNFFIVDSVRIIQQIQHFRTAYSYSVFHVHLIASP